MAAAARPGSPDARDARVPCPQCGGLIHPIAGKCKHCKADLTAFRSARPAANTPLPALNHAPAPVNGQPPHAPIAHAVAMPPAPYDAGRPVLPPRPSAHAATAEPAGSAWRSWPVLVIVLAMLAIVAAVVLMMWPPRSRDGKRALQPPPAPERMDTQTPPVMPKIDSPATPPQAPQGSAHDPWSGQPPTGTDPSAAQDPADPAQADPADADDPDLDAIDLTPRAGPPRRHAPPLNGSGMLVLAMTAHVCQKLAVCDTSDARMKNACDMISRMRTVPPTCPAAQRCFQQIDAMTCSDQPGSLQVDRLFRRFSDCLDAMHC
jgi:hypothetical protein